MINDKSNIIKTGQHEKIKKQERMRENNTTNYRAKNNVKMINRYRKSEKHGKRKNKDLRTQKKTFYVH